MGKLLTKFLFKTLEKSYFRSVVKIIEEALWI